MQAVVRTITIDCRDPYRLAQFWSQVFGTPMHPDDYPDDPEAVARTAGEWETTSTAIRDDVTGQPEQALVLLFAHVPESKSVKNRVHLDLQPSQPRDDDVARLQELGATWLEDHRRPDGSGWVILADPEGNEFCVLMSGAERAALS